MRELVADLAAACLTHDDIGQALRSANGGAPLDPKTLRKYFRDELDHGAAMTRVRAQRRLFQLIDEGNLGAICFFLKAKAGWREVQRVEQTGPDGAALPAAVSFVTASLYLPVKDGMPGLVGTDGPLARRALPQPAQPVAPGGDDWAPLPHPPAQPVGHTEPRAVGTVRPGGQAYPHGADPRR